MAFDAEFPSRQTRVGQRFAQLTQRLDRRWCQVRRTGGKQNAETGGWQGLCRGGSRRWGRGLAAELGVNRLCLRVSSRHSSGRTSCQPPVPMICVSGWWTPWKPADLAAVPPLSSGSATAQPSVGCNASQKPAVVPRVRPAATISPGPSKHTKIGSWRRSRLSGTRCWWRWQPSCGTPTVSRKACPACGDFSPVTAYFQRNALRCSATTTMSGSENRHDRPETGVTNLLHERLRE